MEIKCNLQELAFDQKFKIQQKIDIWFESERYDHFSGV